ncbi:TIGR03503 family protein [Shewanella gelidii]|uniref:TIGR03503 family protein n=1 Tax=Shewanella gelidii TaxID=1642821 RepID=UPI00166DA482|nr:TIGR03503 family protein [Shewanella gelidii]MCL1098604.1 TIGR03503 family protein [Shewanella gelidii]
MNRYLCTLVSCLLLFSLACPVKAEVVPLSQAMELKNRFRIDHMVESVTLMIQRDYGSAPVVIVLPDGSKWYASRHPKEQVQWLDGVTGDIITIANPVPGPWQLLGRVSEGSQIKFLSKLAIQVDPLPQPLFQGERIKVMAKLIGDEQKVRMPGLDYLVEWTARFASEHLPGDENFASGTFIVGSYKDNGEELDERPDDGDFTGKLNLSQPWGNYTFQVRARNNIFTREYKQSFRLSPIPITVNIVKPEDPLTERWHLAVQVDQELLNLEETHFAFELLGPAGLQLPVIQDGVLQQSSQIELPVVTEFGSYRLKGTAASTTKEGREITLSLPEVFFNLVQPPPPPPTAEELAAIAARQAEIAEKEARDKAVFWIAVVNSVLLIVGALGLVIWRKRQSLARNLKQAEENLDVEEPKSKPSLESTLDDIDLTIPDDN